VLGKAGITTGIEFGPDGDLYAAYAWGYSLDSESDEFNLRCRNSSDIYTGVYRINVSTGRVTPVLTKKDGWSACFPDDIAFDRGGNMYVSDLSLSGIWKITPDRKVTLWSKDRLLQFPASPFYEFPEGANDIALSKDEHWLYVGTDGYPMLLLIPINADGSAGAAEILARNLGANDGLAVDELGNIYYTDADEQRLLVFSPDGKQRLTIATKDTAPLDAPTSLEYHDGKICVANSGSFSDPLSVSPTAPKSVTCISGFRRPTVSGAAAQ
jgi:hypothetical protein